VFWIGSTEAIPLDVLAELDAVACLFYGSRT